MRSDKAILFIGAGLETIPGMRRALEMNLHVVASDANPDAPGISIAHDFLLASTYDVAATVAAAKKYHYDKHPLSGVICLGTDVPLTVASVADALALPSISLRSARLASDKLAMKENFAAHNIPIPWFSPVLTKVDLRKIVAAHGFPMVIKPVDSRGARGVLKLDVGTDLDLAFDISQSYSPTGRVMLEKYLDGPQVSTESLMIQGKSFTPGFSDRNYEYLERFAPNIIENGGDLPSCLPPDRQDAIRHLVEKAALAMGITDGVIKGDIVLHHGEPYVIELAARLSGGYFCTHEIPLNTGVDFVGAAIAQCLGDKLDTQSLTPKFNRGVAQRYIFPAPGTVTSIDVPEWLLNDPQIAMCEIRTHKGATIGPIHHHPARAGVVIAVGDDRQSAIDKVTSAIRAIVIETKA